MDCGSEKERLSFGISLNYELNVGSRYARVVRLRDRDIPPRIFVTRQNANEILFRFVGTRRDTAHIVAFRFNLRNDKSARRETICLADRCAPNQITVFQRPLRRTVSTFHLLPVRATYVCTLSFAGHPRALIGLNSRKKIPRMFQLLVAAIRFSYFHFLRESSQRRIHPIYNFSFFNAANGRIDDRRVFNGRSCPGILQLLKSEIRSEIIDDTWNVIN